MTPRACLASLALGTALTTLASCMAPSAHADPKVELPIEVQILEMVNLPGESPRLTLSADERVERVHVVVREAGRNVAGKSLGTVAAGATRDLTWRAHPGVHEYSVQVSGRTSRGAASVAVESVVTVMRPLEVQLRREQVDLEERVLHFSINNPAGRATLAIQNAAGRVMHEAETRFTGKPAGARLELRWPAQDEPIARMQLRVYDASDSWSDFELLPFSVEIPHEDVVFETADADIGSAEEPKLEAAYDAILEAISEHGDDLKARLYIMGHTDSVGSHADNLLLSQRRAAAIARWFMQRGGIALPIVAQGFGESRLLVPTADNVDEAKNRRAQYILAAQAPVATDWKTISAGRATR